MRGGGDTSESEGGQDGRFDEARVATVRPFVLVYCLFSAYLRMIFTHRTNRNPGADDRRVRGAGRE